ncbi:MAG: 30S ribosomal protein S5 [Planctomycetota bacterium]
MAEMIDETGAIESTTIGVYRTAATVKGGRRFSFSSMVVVGDRHGSVGIGYGKANQVPNAIEKAQKVAKRSMRKFATQGTTIPHQVTGRFGACSVRLIPASPGTGVIAGAAVRAPLEMMGVQDCLTKCYGSTNPKNLVRAVLDGLGQLRSKSMIEELRGVSLGETAVEEAIRRSEAILSSKTTGDGANSEEPAMAAAEAPADAGGTNG